MKGLDSEAWHRETWTTQVQPVYEQDLLVWAQKHPDAVGMLPVLKQSILENCGVIFLMDMLQDNLS